MSNGRLRLTLLLTLCGGALMLTNLGIVVRAGDQDDPAVRVSSERLERLDARVAKINDLTADFIERKYTTLLKKPLVSSGRIRVRGDIARWDTIKPYKTVMLVGRGEVRIYYPDRRVEEVFQLGERLGQLAMSPLPRLAALREHFDMTPIPPNEIDANASERHHLALRLRPKAQSLREHVNEIRVLIDETTACVVKIAMDDPTGDRTVIEFSHVKTNTGLEDRDVSLTVPPGTKTTRPLETFGGSQDALEEAETP